MIQVFVISSCCGRGFGLANRIYSKLAILNIHSCLANTSWNEGLEFVKKYNIKKSDCPIIVIDEFGLCFDANKTKDDAFMTDLIKKLSGEGSIITTKEMQ